MLHSFSNTEDQQVATESVINKNFSKLLNLF